MVTRWEISRTELGRIWRANWRKVVCTAFLQSKKELSQSIRGYETAGLNEMISDARKGKINLIVVKDLSRFGRDYIETGKYIDVIFPSLGCRFIALNDGVDTIHKDNEMIMIFKNVMNDFYARDTSSKIKSVRRFHSRGLMIPKHRNQWEGGCVMEQYNRYEFEGEVIEVPVYWDDHLQREVEDYEDYYKQPAE